MSIFASQFNNASPYALSPLDTGTPSIGATLGKATKSGTQAAKVGAEVGASAAATAAASEAASNAAGNSAASSNGKSVSSSQSLSNQGTLNKLTRMEGMNAGAVNAANPVPETNTFTSDSNMFDRSTGPTPKEATVSSPTKSSVTPAASGGFFNDVAHGFDSTRHAVSASTDWLMNTNGTPNASSPNNMGSSKSYAPRSTTDTHVTEPANTWNPSQYTGSSSGNGVAAGVSSPSAMAGASAPKAVGMNGAYNEQQFGRVQGARNAVQGQMDNQNEGVWGDIGGEAENWLEHLQKVATSPEGIGAGSDD